MMPEIPPTLVAWSFNFDLNSGVKMPNLNLHTTKVSGIFGDRYGVL